MRHAGFVLTGGRSRRMGRNKALLDYHGEPLAVHIARQVADAAGTAALIGSPAVYGGLGYPVHPDLVPECGPLGGIYTALRLAQADWNLIVACDLPWITASHLNRILDAARHAGSEVECILPFEGSGRPQPLCAAYHCRCLRKVEIALHKKRLPVRHLVGECECITLHGFPAEAFSNVNTPSDWEGVMACPNR